MSFIIQDWAGGIPDKLFLNNKFFEPYVSDKGVSQNTGLGLSLIRRACKGLSLTISYKVNNNSTTVTINKE